MAGVLVNHNLCNCEKEKCAWWDAFGQQCTSLFIGSGVDYLKDNLAELCDLLKKRILADIAKELENIGSRPLGM